MIIQKSQRIQIFIYLFLAITSFCIHYMFMLKGFGEPDACRLALWGKALHDNVSFEAGHIATYPLRTSPLYILGIKLLLQSEVPLLSIPYYLNILNVVASSVLICLAYGFWSKMTNSIAAFAGCVILFFTPTFWLSSIYGMPHLPALAFFFGAFIVYYSAVGNSDLRFYLKILICFILFFLAISCKADIILTFGAFLLLSIVSVKSELCLRLKIRNTLSICAAIFLAIISKSSLTKYIYPAIHDSKEFASTWTETFPFTIKAITSLSNFNVTYLAIGYIFFFVFFCFIAFDIMKEKKRSLQFICLSWILPAVIFWGLIMGNSSRHLTAAYFMLPMFSVSLIHKYIPEKKVFFGLIILMIFFNYQSSENSYLDSTVQASSKIFKSPDYIQKRIDKNIEIALEFQAIEDEYKILNACGQNVPYYQYYSICRSDSYERVNYFMYKFHYKNKKHQTVMFSYHEEKLSNIDAKWNVYKVVKGKLVRVRRGRAK